MSGEKPGVADYPLSETHPDLVRGARGKSLDALDLAALERGDVGMEDLRITGAALEMQASIARDGGREKLADNFERASELVDIPQDYLMQIYELLRPGRAQGQADLLEVAGELRGVHNAPLMAAFIEEAAEVYEARGLFTARF